MRIPYTTYRDGREPALSPPPPVLGLGKPELSVSPRSRRRGIRVEVRWDMMGCDRMGYKNPYFPPSLFPPHPSLLTLNMHPTALLSSLLLLAPGVLGHGYLKTIIVGGVSYPGWEPFSDPYITPAPVRYTRTFKDNGPVPDFTGQDITCNTGGNNPIRVNIPVRAGSQVFVPCPVSCVLSPQTKLTPPQNSPPPTNPTANTPQQIPMGPMGLLPFRPRHDLHRQMSQRLRQLQRQLRKRLGQDRPMGLPTRPEPSLGLRQARLSGRQLDRHYPGES